MYFSHQECLHYSETRTVYFILGNFVYVFQSSRVSSLLRDTDCLLYCGTRTVSIVQAPGVLKKTKCLADTVCLVMSQGMSILLLHVSSLLLYSVFLLMSIGFVYLVQSSVFTITGTTRKRSFSSWWGAFAGWNRFRIRVFENPSKLGKLVLLILPNRPELAVLELVRPICQDIFGIVGRQNPKPRSIPAQPSCSQTPYLWLMSTFSIHIVMPNECWTVTQFPM